MKRTSLRRVAALSLVVALAVPIAALAWPGHDRDRGERMQKKLDALELDPETRAQLESLFEAGREARQERKQALREARKQLRALLHDDAVGESELLGQAEAIAALEFEGHKARISRHLALRELLTPEQREALRADRQRRKHHDGEDGEGEDGERRGKHDRRHGHRR